MPETLPDLLTRAAQRFPERIAVSGAGVRFRYAEVEALTDAVAAALQGEDLQGRRVGLLLPNHVAFPMLLHGVLRAGARALMMNPQYSPREAREALADAGCDTVITAGPLLPLLPAGTRTLLVEDLPARFRAVDAEGERSIPLRLGARPAPLAARPDDEAVVVFTAAMRGRAMGARLSHRNIVANAAATVEAMRLTPDDVVVGILPYIHLFGQTVTMHAALMAGARIVPVERFNPVRLLDALEEEGVTVLCGVPGIFAGLAAAAERRGTPAHRLRVAISGGSPLPLEVGRRWEEVFGLPLREGYGLTEAGPVCLFNRVDRPNHPGTMGYPFPGVEVAILGPDGAALPDGEVGEICIRGDNVFLGYIGEEGRSARDFHGDWLRSGDLGTVEGDGVIRYRGLLKPMFTRNGFNVYPLEVARTLEEDPRIEGVRVCAQPDPVKENEVVLFVRRAPGTDLSEEQLREVCRQRLAVFKQPARIHFEDEPHPA